MKDYYQILELTKDASDADIKSAYRRLAKKYHPDTNRGDSSAEGKFKEINEAYDVLKDPTKRHTYNSDNPQPRPRQNTHTYWGNSTFDDLNIDDIIKDMNRSRWSPDAKNRDITLTYNITLDEAFSGKEALIRYTIAGVEKEINVKIPMGISDGLKLRFKGQGDDAMRGVPAGDLYVKITVIPHHCFVRDGDNLVYRLTIGYLDALVGVERELPTIDGGRIKMRVPRGVHPGQQLRVPNKGMMKSDGSRGNMMVEISLSPEQLSDDERLQISDILSKRNG